MTQSMKRPVQVANAAPKSSTLNRLGRVALANVMSAIDGIFGTSLAEARAAAGFINDAMRPSADGTTNEVTLLRGLAYVRDSSVEDVEWAGEVRPMYLENNVGIAMPTNNDANGFDRIDVIGVRSITEESDVQTVRQLLAPGGPITTTDAALTNTYLPEFQIFTGVASASPVVPPVTGGFIEVARVFRQNGVTNVAATDVTDARAARSTLRAELAELFSGLYVGRFADDAWWRIERADDNDAYFEEGDLLLYDNDYADTEPTGKLHLGQLATYGDIILGAVSGALQQVRNAAGQISALGGRNLPIAVGTYVWDNGNTRFNLVAGYNLPAQLDELVSGTYEGILPDQTQASAPYNQVICQQTPNALEFVTDQMTANIYDDVGNMKLQVNVINVGNTPGPPVTGAGATSQLFVVVYNAARV